MKEVCATCKRPFTKRRSNAENKYYWKIVVGILAEETGYSDKEMHEILKRRFLTEHRIVRGKKGEVIQMETDGSTAGLTTVKFEELMSQIRIWASRDLSIYIPSPNENVNAAERISNKE